MRSRRITKLAVAAALMASTALWSLPSDAGGVAVGDATEEQVASATEPYLKAKDAFAAKQFEDALTGFRASHDIVASPNARYMIVASLSELGRHVEAYKETLVGIPEAEAALAGDAKYEKTLNDLKTAKSELRGKIGMLTITVSGAGMDAAVAIDGESVKRGEWGQPIPVSAGSHSVTVTGHEAKQVDVAAGGEASADFAPPVVEPEPEPEPESDPIVDVSEEDSENWFIENRRIIAYAAGGVGVVGMGLFGVFGGLALSKQGDLDDNCTANKQCPTASQDDIDSGKTFQVVANTMLVVGAVGLAAGVGLFVWDILDEPSGDGGDPEDDDGDELSRLRLHVGPGQVTIRGSF